MRLKVSSSWILTQKTSVRIKEICIGHLPWHVTVYQLVGVTYARVPRLVELWTNLMCLITSILSLMRTCSLNKRVMQTSWLWLRHRKRLTRCHPRSTSSRTMWQQHLIHIWFQLPCLSACLLTIGLCKEGVSAVRPSCSIRIVWTVMLWAAREISSITTIVWQAMPMPSRESTEIASIRRLSWFRPAALILKPTPPCPRTLSTTTTSARASISRMDHNRDLTLLLDRQAVWKLPSLSVSLMPTVSWPTWRNKTKKSVAESVLSWTHSTGTRIATRHNRWVSTQLWARRPSPQALPWKLLSLFHPKSIVKLMKNPVSYRLAISERCN